MNSDLSIRKENARTANIGFCASRAEGITIGICPLLYFGSGRSFSISLLVLNFNFIFSISSGSGQTEFYFPTCTKPCSLPAIFVDTLNAMKKFLFLTFLLIVARLSDIITTYIYIPNLEKELNPIVSVFGQGWTTMLLVQVIIISGFIYSLWVYSTKKLTLPKVDNSLTLKEFISLLNFKDTISYKKIFYKIPKNKTAIFYTIGYCGTISLIVLSFLVAISTTFLILSPDYRIFYRNYKIPVFLILSFVVMFIILLIKFYKSEYKNWLGENKTAGNIGIANSGA
jgi:hypothetical protein